jgi:phosphoribosylamine--glycine ligase
VKVCVVGGGGREHALASALARSADVVVTPGNPGMVDEARSITVTGAPPEELDADLFVIGPEAPLVAGLADRLRAAGKRVFGPGADGARLEGSKAHMKELLVAAGVPTARHASFSELAPAVEFLRSLPGSYVVKTDGLAAGKGVLVTSSFDEAAADVAAKLSGDAFGDAGRRVVIEEGLVGPELTLLVVCDGERAVPLAPSQDFKRVGDGDTGPNTGGMGAYSPVRIAGSEIVDRVMDEAVEPTLAALRRGGVDYRGVLYAGLMLTPEGPKIIEYNVRFGDPESQVVLPRLTSDLAGLLAAAADGRLDTVAAPTFASDAAVTVICSVEGYPTSPRTGDLIEGLDEARAVAGVEVFCAGVAAASEGPASDHAGGGRPSGAPAGGGEDQTRLVTAGGRVLAVTGVGPDVAAARTRAYAGVERLSWPGMHHRTDIAAHA